MILFGKEGRYKKLLCPNCRSDRVDELLGSVYRFFCAKCAVSDSESACPAVEISYTELSNLPIKQND